MTRSRLLFAGIILATSTACSPGDRNESNTGWSGVVSDSAGVVVVANSNRGLWREDERWTVVEDLRIGAAGGDPDYQFGQVGSVGVNSKGEIFVSDRQASEVRVFSPDGEFIHTLGAPGSGPGQFAPGVMQILITQGDTLLVPDLANQRINRFLPDGSPGASARVDLDLGRPLNFIWDPTSKEGAVQVRPGTPRDPLANSSDVIRVVETSGEFGDTLLVVPSGGLFQEGGLKFFTPEPTWILSDSLTVLYAVNSEYRIMFHDRHGNIRRIVSKAHEPRPIGERDIRALFIYLDRRWTDIGVTPAGIAENHRRVGFAEFFPAFYMLRLGPDGSMWVQPVQSPADLSDEEIERYNFIEDFGAPGWDVFDAEGRYLGVVEMPPRFQPRTFVGDRIYGVWRDDLDVQYIVRLEVGRGSSQTEGR
ncbi:MAG: 6-bladed beta-propeller [Gemmatimonadota bacterium]|nr:6-bladed beta-propeller [Gemmatimonadota bacterium]